jgi:DNA polymerase-3 subunit epsilon
VRENGRPPAEAVDEIAHAVAKELIDGTPVVGMNVTYDLTILDRECRRNGLPTVDDRLDGKALAPVIDVFVLDKAIDRYRKGGRKLVDLCRHYRVRIDGAHDSTQDAIAAARVAWKIAAENPALAAMSLTDLHAQQVKWAAEQGANFAQHLRRIANEKVHEAGKAHAAGNTERQEIAQQEADELFARVDAMDGAWPLRPYAGGA